MRCRGLTGMQRLPDHNRTSARFVPALVVTALAGLGLGLTLPIIAVRNFWVFHGSYSILDGIAMLVRQGDVLIAVVVAAFSVAVPVAKNLALLGLWWKWRRGRPVPHALPALLEAIGKWSMLDVFVVALLVFAVKTRAVADATVADAIVPFLASIVLTMIGGRLMHRAFATTAEAGAPGRPLRDPP